MRITISRIIGANRAAPTNEEKSKKKFKKNL
jgi:hypothetical protein